MTLAQELFDASIKVGLIEELLNNFLCKTYVDWDDFTYDCYDESLEIYGIRKQKAPMETLRELGFKLVWEHPFNKGADPEGSNWCGPGICKCSPLRF